MLVRDGISLRRVCIYVVTTRFPMDAASVRRLRPLSQELLPVMPWRDESWTRRRYNLPSISRGMRTTRQLVFLVEWLSPGQIVSNSTPENPIPQNFMLHG